MSPTRQRLLPLIALSATIAVCPCMAQAAGYGRLIARHSATPSGVLDTSFDDVRAPRSFLLAITESRREPLEFRWSIHCLGTGPKERGGASGRATVSSGHWVKRIRPVWIKHPVSCSGTIVGSAAASSVLVRVFAN
jgi:hypothetical protein